MALQRFESAAVKNSETGHDVRVSVYAMISEDYFHWFRSTRPDVVGPGTDDPRDVLVKYANELEKNAIEREKNERFQNAMKYAIETLQEQRHSFFKSKCAAKSCHV